MDRREFNKSLGAFVTVLTARNSLANVAPDAEYPGPQRTLNSQTMMKFLRSSLAQYNPVWDTPSTSSLGSMPLSGSQGTGLNVWVQEGAVYFYIGRNDTYDEDGNLLKLGCIRLSLNPNPLSNLKTFQQKLDIYTSRITIQAEDNDGRACKILLWLDVRQPVVFVEATSTHATQLEASFMTWRDKKRAYPLENWNLPDVGRNDFELRKATLDHIETGPEALLWYHQNDNADLIVNQLVQKQKFTEKSDTIVDPSRSLIFGGVLRGNNLAFATQEPIRFQEWEGQSWNYRSRTNATKHLCTVSLTAEQTSDLAAWKKRLMELSTDSLKSKNREAAKRFASQSWASFWEKSYIFINSGKGPEDIGWQVGKNYQLFRYMLGCNRGGSLPLKFNGGIFNVDPHKAGKYLVEDGTQPDASPPDNRRWSNLIMAQNQRLLGWPGLMSGDSGLVTPSLNFYADRVKTAVARSQIYWHHNGAAFVEPLSLYGLPVQDLATDYGPCSAKHLAYHFSIMIEFAWMALEWASYSGQSVAQYLPMIEAIVRFYDEHYRQVCLKSTGKEFDSAGHLVLYPMNCLELYANTTDPIEVVCGLHRVVTGVLALPSDNVPSSTRTYFEQLRPHLPTVHFEVRDGKQVLKPAKNYDPALAMNVTEFPEMYAVWPYRLFGIGSRNGNTVANNTWELLPQNRQAAMDYVSWQCTPIYAALMGRLADAKRLTIDKLADQHASLRFTAFFGPGHDWIPDHNWGGSAMVGLQSMLVSPADDGIHLLPAWPDDWDVDFKLHLPEQGILWAQVKTGEITKVTLARADGKPYPRPLIRPRSSAPRG